HDIASRAFFRAGIAALLAGCGRYHFFERDGGATNEGVVDADKTYRGLVLADHPIAYYRLDDIGATARDEMGMHDGTYLGACARVPGVLVNDSNGAVQFDGTTCYVDIVDAFNFAGTSSFTIEAWASFAPGAANYNHLFTRQRRNGVGPLDGI